MAPPTAQSATLRIRSACATASYLAALLCLLVSAAPLRAQATRPADGASGLVLEPAGPRILETLPILRVEVEGNTRTDSRIILDQVRAQAGQPYARAQAEVDVRSIASLDRFATVVAQVTPVENANHELTGVVVRFKVEERSLVVSVDIAGNRKFTSDELRTGLVMRPGAALHPSWLESDRKYMLDLYHKKGYAQATVEFDPQAIKDGVIHWKITEGPISQISDVRFDGLHAFKASYLKSKVQTKSSLWIFRKGLLDMDLLEQDLVTIREEYRKHAYLDAHASYVLDYSEDKSQLIVRFDIIEGPHYTVGNINLTGNTVFRPDELLDPRFGPGSFAEQERIDFLKRRIIDTYGHEGYIYVNDATVEIGTVYTETPGVVDLNINITEGKPYLVGRIIIRGNPNTQDAVIRRQIRIYPDQTFDMVLVKKSIDRLKAERIFTDAKITPISSPGTPEGVRDALVEVTEAPEGRTGRFTFGAGVSTNAGLVGRFSLEQQNFDITNFPHSLGEFLSGQSFKGAGQYYQLLLEPGTEFQRYRLRFEEPSVFDSPYSFVNDIYYFTRARESWDERRIGDTMTFGRHFGDIWMVSLALRAEQVSITHPTDTNRNGISDTDYFLVDSTGTPQGPFNDSAQEILDAQGSHFLTSIRPGIARDTTDSRTFPTTGTRSSLTWEQYGVAGGAATFSKIGANFDWFTPLYTDLFDRKTVLSVRNEVGVIPLGSSPFYERYYLGGIGELRGFHFRGVSPRAGPRRDPVGGDFSWYTTVEVNYPIYEEMVRGVVFADVGTVEKDLAIHTIRSDFGVGVRIALPLFHGIPIAFDVAYPTTKASGDRTQLLSIALGLPF